MITLCAGQLSRHRCVGTPEDLVATHTPGFLNRQPVNSRLEPATNQTGPPAAKERRGYRCVRVSDLDGGPIVNSGVRVALEAREIEGANGGIRDPAAGRGPGGSALLAKPNPRRAVVEGVAAHPCNVPTGEVLVGEALEERGGLGATQQHECIVGRGLQVVRAGFFEEKAVALVH